MARLRDHLAHRYFDTNHAVLQATVDNDLPELRRKLHHAMIFLQWPNGNGVSSGMGYL